LGEESRSQASQFQNADRGGVSNAPYQMLARLLVICQPHIYDEHNRCFECDAPKMEIVEMPAKSSAERQKAWRERNAKLIEVRVRVKTRAQAEKIKDIAKEMREGK